MLLPYCFWARKNVRKRTSANTLSFRDDCTMCISNTREKCAHRIRSFLTMAGAFLGYTLGIYFNILFSVFSFSFNVFEHQHTRTYISSIFFFSFLFLLLVCEFALQIINTARHSTHTFFFPFEAK